MQGRSRPGAGQEQGNSWEEARVGQELGRNRAGAELSIAEMAGARQELGVSGEGA